MRNELKAIRKKVKEKNSALGEIPKSMLEMRRQIKEVLLPYARILEAESFNSEATMIGPSETVALHYNRCCQPPELDHSITANHTACVCKY